MAPSNGQPPDPPFPIKKNRYQTERMSASRYIIQAQRFSGNSDSGKTVGNTRKLQTLANIDDGNWVHRARSHLENSNHCSKLVFMVSNKNERNIIRKPGNTKLQGTNQYTQKLKENINNIINSYLY